MGKKNPNQNKLCYIALLISNIFMWYFSLGNCIIRYILKLHLWYAIVCFVFTTTLYKKNELRMLWSSSFLQKRTTFCKLIRKYASFVTRGRTSTILKYWFYT